MSMIQFAHGRFQSPIVVPVVAQGNYPAYKAVELVWNDTLNIWEATSISSQDQLTGVIGIIQDTTTADTRNVRAVVRGETKVHTDISALTNGHVVTVDGTGEVGALGDNPYLRGLGFAIDVANQKVWFDGNNY